ncbi:MAG: DVU0150 family protein [Thermodesulfobacteriota bacterium]
MKRSLLALGLGAAVWLAPGILRAAGGGDVSELVLVADTRNLTGIQYYFATLYNENIWLFAVWSVVLTTALGCVLGVIMDFIMNRIGLDLRKRSIVEH